MAGLCRRVLPRSCERLAPSVLVIGVRLGIRIEAGIGDGEADLVKDGSGRLHADRRPILLHKRPEFLRREDAAIPSERGIEDADGEQANQQHGGEQTDGEDFHAGVTPERAQHDDLQEIHTHSSETANRRMKQDSATIPLLRSLECDGTIVDHRHWP